MALPGRTGQERRAGGGGVRVLASLTIVPSPAVWVLGPGSELVLPPPPGMALSGLTPAPSWEEDECLDYYGMLSLHRMFEVVGGQLTECELELLAFLLDEAPGAAGGLARARSGLELLLELERRGQCDESNLRLLGQLLRVLARHDLLPHLARKRRRPGMVEWQGDRLPVGMRPCPGCASRVLAPPLCSEYQ